VVNFSIELKDPVDERITIGRARCDKSLTQKIIRIADKFKIDDTNALSELADKIVELKRYFVSAIPADTSKSPLPKDHSTVKETRTDLENLQKSLDKAYKISQKIFSPQKPNYLAIMKLHQYGDYANIEDFIIDLDITRNRVLNALNNLKGKKSPPSLEDWKYNAVDLCIHYWKNKVEKESEPKVNFIVNSIELGNEFTKFTCEVLYEFAGINYSQCKTILTKE